MLTRTTLITVFVVFASVLGNIVAAQTAAEIAQKTVPSVVPIVTQDKNGQELALGSGFIVKDGLIATNGHVIEGAAHGYVKLVDQKPKFDIAGIVASDPDHDLVLLSVNDIKGPSLPLSNGDIPKIGDSVFAVGNPRGLEGTFSQGIVSSVRKLDGGTLLQITAPISPGSSGGPVVSSSGTVIGVSVATYKGGQNLNFAVPSSYLVDLVAHPGVLKELEAKPDVPKPKSYVEQLGERSTVGVSGSNLLWEYETKGGDDDFSFSLSNRLTTSIENIRCLVVFFGFDDNPVDFQLVEYPEVLPGGVAKRLKGRAGESVRDLTTRRNGGLFARTPTGRVEYRILDFEIVTD